MRKAQLRVGIALLLLLGGASAYVAGGMRLFGQYQAAYASFLSSCNALIEWSPPATVYTAFYANQPALLSLRYRSPSPQPLRISLGIPQLTQQQTIQVDATPTFQQRALKPPLLGGPALDALVGSRQAAAQIRLTVQDDTRTLCDTSVPVVLKSRQVMHWYSTAAGDNAQYLAGWVTPQDPTIATLIGRATSRAALTGYALTGYDAGRATPDAVRNQVDAIFDTLQFDYHVHYANDNVPYAHDAEQIIQLPRDILTNPTPTAMCLETTAIMASAVERLGMRPLFIIVPGHAFLGVALGASPSSPFEYWETSRLNGQSGDTANVDGDMEYTMADQQRAVLRIIDVQDERAQNIGPIE